MHFQSRGDQLGPKPFLFGEHMQVLDIYPWMLCWWVDADCLAATCPGITSLRDTAQARPALATVRARHFG